VIVFLVQASLSFVVLFLLVVWFVGPYLATQPIRKVMLLLLAPHVIHHVGLALLVPGVVGPGFPSTFALVIAVGEPTMLFLWILCVGALRYHSPRALPLLWIFTAVGITYNLVSAAVAVPVGSEVVSKLHAHWYVAVFYVPLLAASHILILLNLLKRGRELEGMRTVS
jgi:hypothetical protein